MPPLHLLILAHAPERRDALLSALRGAGYLAVPAPDGPAAAEAIGAPGFDALVVDLGWPELELRRLREALAPSGDAEPDSLEAAERRHIALTLRYTGGNRRRAAQLLGISRSTLLHKVRKYGLDES
jgi:DNA-binding NtrC family response regulator